MERIYEVTTISGPVQRYEVIKVSPTTFASGNKGFSFETLEGPNEPINHLASHVHHMYSLTGLEDAIREYPGIREPERLRLIYDVFPLSWASPILRISPVEDSGHLCMIEYDFRMARLPLERITFSHESDGSLDITFTGLKVLLHLRNWEEENREYYGRDLRKSCMIDR